MKSGTTVSLGKIGTVVAEVARYENMRIWNHIYRVALGRMHNSASVIRGCMECMEKCINVKLEKALNMLIKGRYEESVCEGATFATTVPKLWKGGTLCRR